jgi:hypothetical protein
MSDDRSGALGRGARRRVVTAGRLLVLLMLFNAAFLAAFALDRRSRRDPQFCSSCHNMRAHVESYVNGSNMDAVHRRAEVGCKDCHADYTVADELRSVVAYALGQYEEVFSRRVFDQRMCTGCHLGMEHQAQRTDHLARNPHRSHYPDLRCGACHPAHARQVDYCGACHDNGGQRMTGGPTTDRAVAPWLRFTMPGTAGASSARIGGEADHG